MTTIYIKSDAELAARREHDSYPTEITLATAGVARGVSLYSDFLGLVPLRPEVLDVGAGTGVWGHACLDIYQRHLFCPTRVTGVELQDLPCPEGFADWVAPQDFLTWETERRFNVIVSNPPYYIAEPVIYKSWDLLKPKGVMVFLLRLAFQAGVARYFGLWSSLPVVEVAVVSRRPSFYGRGTNSTDYGVYYWLKGEDGKPVGKPLRWHTSLLLHERPWKDQTSSADSSK